MSDEPNAEVLARYVLGVSPADEAERIRAWISASPVNAGELERWRAVWASSGELLAARAGDRVDAVAGAARVRRLTERPFLERPFAPDIVRPRRAWPRVWPGVIVASLCAVIAVGLSLGSWRNARSYMTGVGQRLSVTLADGSRITLAPASRMRIIGVREVTLEGEAYFSVFHDDAHPFSVRAHGVITRDVGTSFDVRAYTDDADERIAITEGAVVVERGGRVGDPPLRAGDVAVVNDSGVAVTHHADVAVLTAWMQGHLVFAGTPLREVVRELSRTFDVTITLADSTLGGELVTGDFGNQSVNNILDAIAAVTNAQYERHGRQVTIRRATATTAKPTTHVPVLQTTSTRTSSE